MHAFEAWILTLVVLASCILQTAAQAACYSPNGTNINAFYNVTNGYWYAACDATAEHSMCCAIGAGRGDDKCQVNGLCYNAGANLYWRESCTDKTWKSEACIKLFVNGTGYNGTKAQVDDGVLLTDVSVTPCDDGSYCYGTGPGALACCAAGEGYFIVNGTETKQNPNVTTTTTTSSTTSSATSSHTATRTATASHTSTADSGLSTGAKAGIGVGVALGVILVAGLVAFFVLRGRRKHHRDASPVTDHYTDAVAPPSSQPLMDKKSPPPADAYESYEMEPHAPRAELDHGRPRAEMEG